VQALSEGDLANQAMEYVVELGQVSSDGLAPYLQDRDPVVRARTAIAAGFSGGPRTEAELSKLTTDGDPSVRRAAEVALMRMRTLKQTKASG
jgi:hypothetical protein